MFVNLMQACIANFIEEHFELHKQIEMMCGNGLWSDIVDGYEGILIHRSKESQQ